MLAESGCGVGCVCVQPYKRYPRDSLVLGRVKVELKDANGTPKHPELPTRK